jgi:CubicO group peptidase (beta-lactamase class C family)
MGGPAVADLTARRLTARLARAQVQGRLPSLVAALVRDGEVVWREVVGDSVTAAGEPSGAPYDTQYRIGSITKTVTAVLVHQLVRDGRLDLDAPAAVALGDVGYADRSLRSLLAHNGGLQSEPVGDWWERTAGLSWAELAAGNDGSGAVFPPLQQFHYSNLGFALLGEVVARVHGRPWWECARDHVLAPLGMARTSYSPEGVAAQGFSVHPYAGTLHREPATDTQAMAPAGQLWSTVTDLATYARFLLEGHPDVLSADLLAAAAHPQSGDRHEGLDSAYGLGLMLLAGGSGTLVGHSGSMPGFVAGCFVDPERRTGVALLANGTVGLPGDLASGLLEELERCEPTVPRPWRPTTELSATVADVLGVWHWGNTPFVLGWADGMVVANRFGEDRFGFVERDGRLVGSHGYHAGETLHVHRRPDGTVSHLEVATFVFTRAPYDPDVTVPGGHPD